MQFQLKIQLKDINITPIWRTVLVPGHFSFVQLHEVIQAAFGWENIHDYCFFPEKSGKRIDICIPFDDEWEAEDKLDSEKITLGEIFKKNGQKVPYVYDFEDSWVHIIEVENILKEDIIRATLIGGKGACPPEDCAGPQGYLDILEMLADPENEEHEAIREWLEPNEGEKYDIEAFDEEKARKEVEEV